MTKHAEASPAPSVAAVVVAAGCSTRMGRPKPLLPWHGGQPVIVHVVQNLIDAGAGQIVVVLGHEARQVEKALVAAFPAGAGVEMHLNSQYEHGEMLSSVQVGATAVRGRCDAFILALVDQPGVAPSTIRRLIAAWRDGEPPLAVPEFAGKRGHPLLVSSRLIEQTLALDPTRNTLRDLVQRHRPQMRIVAVGDPAVVMDLDTPHDYQQALDNASSRSGD